MVSNRDAAASDALLSADTVAAREFNPARRGYDQQEVRRYLKAVASEMQALSRRVSELQGRLEKAESKASAPELSEEDVVAAVGDEMAATLRSAHAAATDLRKRAADEAEQLVDEARQRAQSQVSVAERRLDEATAESKRLLDEATAESTRLLDEASEETGRQRADAEAEAEQRLSSATADAAERRSEAQEEAARLVTEATEEAQRKGTELTAAADEAAASTRRDAISDGQQVVGKARADAEEVRQQTEQERREMIESAQALRERVLADLAKRRRVATIQIEQLRAGRERLIESYAVVHRTLDEVQGELQRADAEARAAADEVGRRYEDGAEDEPHSTSVAATPDVADGGEAADGGEELSDVAGGPEGRDTDGDGVSQDASAGSEVATPAAKESAPAKESGPAKESVQVLPSTAAAPAASRQPGRVGGPSGVRERVRVVSVGAAATRSGDPAGRTATAAEPVPGSGAVGSGGHLRVVSGSAAPAVDRSEPEAEGGVTPAGLELVRDARSTTQTTTGSQPSGKTKSSKPAGSKGSAGGTDAVGSLFNRIRTGRKQGGDKSQPAEAADTQAADGAATDAPAADTPATDAPVTDTAGTEEAVTEVATPVESAAPVTGAAAAHNGVAATAAGTTDEAGPADGVTEAETPPGPSGDGDANVAHSDADEALLQRRDAALADLERDLNRRLKRALQDEQNDLLDRLRGAKGTPKADKMLPDLSVQIGHYVAATEPPLTKAASAGAEMTADLLGMPAKAKTRSGTTSMTELAQGAAERIVEPLRRRIGEIFADQGDEGAETITESLGSVYRSARNQRVERVAADVLTSAFASAAWHATPDGTVLRWIAEDADGPCPDCDDNALAGPMAKGDAFPTGQQYPPAHEGCRCLLVPDPG